MLSGTVVELEFEHTLMWLQSLELSTPAYFIKRLELPCREHSSQRRKLRPRERNRLVQSLMQVRCGAAARVEPEPSTSESGTQTRDPTTLLHRAGKVTPTWVQMSALSLKSHVSLGRVMCPWL